MTPDTLSDARSQIDAIDDRLTALFLQRMAVSQRIAELKKQQGLPILNQGREEIVLQRVAEKAGETLAPFAVELYKKIMELSRKYQTLQ